MVGIASLSLLRTVSEVGMTVFLGNVTMSIAAFTEFSSERVSL
jgi:hypothetical protein